ncbi:MAG: dihydropteroate synthase [Planctomycetes bacterium]|nr:dihydropteroate synthase [Planctomycetota bacterium]
MWIDEPRGRRLEVGAGRTRLMGVLNVTPDSFHDGGRWLDPERAVAQGLALVAAGADLLDVGGESTRPGHEPVPPAVQIERVAPVIRALADRVAVPISIDTTRAEVASAALDAGAHWVNDTTALRADDALGPLCAERGCPVVLMHRFEPPRRSAAAGAPGGRALVRAIATVLAERVDHAVRCGIDAARIVLDPGVGFGTLPTDNVAMHAFVDELRALGRPLLFGTSRKSFLGHLAGRGDTAERLAATAASVAWLAAQGVEILRVHDVAEMRDVCAVIDAIRGAGEVPP